MILNRTIRNIKRIQQVIRVLIKYGFEEIVTTTTLKRFVPNKRKLGWIRQDRSIFEYTRWERIRMAIEDLGPTFVKGAQVLSNRADLLPLELIAEFQKLLDQVPPVDTPIIKRVFEKECGKSIDEIFKYFDEKPLGSASIGQVHRAVLLDGTDVVVKIQRPKVREIVTTDLIIIKEIVSLAENYFKKNGILNPMDVVTTFEQTMHKELDYVTEARSMNQFRKFYRNETSFKVPRAYRDLSTSMVLVQEFVSGCKITDVDQLMAWDLKPADIAEKGLDVYLKQIFEHGYFHADPHPGNILVKPDGTLYLIDFGMVGKLSKRNKQAFAGMLVGMAQQDARSIAANLRRLAVNSEIDDMRAFQTSLDELLDQYAMQDVEDMNISELSQSLQRVIYNYKLTIPGSIFLILRALVILEGIGKQIHPTFNTFEFLKPYGIKIMRDQYSPKNIAAELYYSSSQFFSLLNSLPGDIKSILRNIKTGKLHIEVDNPGHHVLSKQVRKASDKLTLALIIGGLLIASSILMTAELNTTQILGIPVVSFTGFLISAVLSVVVLFQIMRGSD